jgi:hypothetical protein
MSPWLKQVNLLLYGPVQKGLAVPSPFEPLHSTVPPGFLEEWAR